MIEPLGNYTQTVTKKREPKKFDLLKIIMKSSLLIEQKRYVVSSRPVFRKKHQNSAVKFKDFVRQQRHKI